MIHFEVDETCGHCKSAITSAVHALDPAAALSRGTAESGHAPVAGSDQQDADSRKQKEASGGRCCG